MDKGIVLLAFGKPCYYRAAYNMAVSIKHFYPQVKIALLRDNAAFKDVFPLWNKLFDLEVFIDESDLSNPGLIKTKIYKYLPFENNLYLDVDGIALQSCEVLLDELASAPDYYKTRIFTTYNSESPNELPMMIWAYKNDIWEHYKFTNEILPATQSSIQFIRKGPESELLFKMWSENLENNPIPLNKLRYSWGGSQPDELYLNVTLAQLGIIPNIGEDAMFFGNKNRGTESFYQLKARVIFLSIYGGRGFINTIYTDWYDKELIKYYYARGESRVFKAHTIYEGKHSNKKPNHNQKVFPAPKKEVKPVNNHKISIALTNYNRTDLLFKSVEKVLNDERVSEVVISDDASDAETYLACVFLFKEHPKVIWNRNEVNLGMSANKNKAVSLCTNEWVILLDSDNVIDKSYIDALYKNEWNKETIYAPDFAKPQFNYTAFSGKTISSNNVDEFIDKPLFDCLLNTCNYFFYAPNYLKVFEGNDKIKETDTIWFNYLWLKSGRNIYVAPNLQYNHLVHDGSGFMQNAEYNFAKADEIKQKIKKLSNRVTCELMGRMGNQMFQLAATIAYAKKHGLEYVVPEKSMDENVWKTYFNFSVNGYVAPSVYKEKAYHYSEIPKLKNVKLEGYFQSEKYFKEYRSEILELFNLGERKPIDSVSIHVRRGDYLLHPRQFPVLREEYYRVAIRKFEQKGFNKFMVFSDDIEWCKEFFIMPGCDFVFSEGKSEKEDMLLMSNCTHNIISNSSFSWWAGWLNQNPDKIVIAPDKNKWFGIMNRNLNTKDLIPETWEQITF